MKIHAICVVKDESDIVAQTLKSAAQWCDHIYILDNGSTDRTWEKVLDLAREYQQITPYKQDNCVFYNGLRGEVFQHYRFKAAEGDWWCRLDADEIYIDDPRIFLAKVPHEYQAVWAASFQYYFTDKDLERYQQKPSLYANDVPIEQKCHYYLNNWSEPRFFRYDKRIVWDRNQGWPHFGAFYPVRIRLKHYQYRSPQQIQRRVNIRCEARVKGSDGFLHEAQSNWEVVTNNSSRMSFDALRIQPPEEVWKKRIVKASQLNYDAHNGNYVMREDLMPKIPSGIPILINKTRGLKKYKLLKKILRVLLLK